MTEGGGRVFSGGGGGVKPTLNRRHGPLGDGLGDNLKEGREGEMRGGKSGKDGSSCCHCAPGSGEVGERERGQYMQGSTIMAVQAGQYMQGSACRAVQT